MSGFTEGCGGKHQFRNKHAIDVSNDRQKKILNLLLKGFEGKLTTSKWAKITKCSPDTALRGIQCLVEKEILKKSPDGGRNTHYLFVE